MVLALSKAPCNIEWWYGYKDMINQYDVIIIGAGASGLMAGITAGRNGERVLILEANDKPGRKILATGNGKCNFTNLYIDKDSFRSDNPKFVEEVLSEFNVEKTIDFFDKLGIYYKNKNGYLYPHSEQAASVVKVLIMEAERLRIKIEYNTYVKKISKPNFTLITDNSKWFSQKLIIATGGCASSKLGSDGSGYTFAKALGHNIIKPVPALVQLLSSNKYCKNLAGVRANGLVKVYEGNKLIVCEEGELQFTNYGISGIPILQISRYVTKLLDRKAKVKLEINLLNEMSEEKLYELINKRIHHSTDKTVYGMLIGLFNEKLINVLLGNCKIRKEIPAERISKKDVDRLVNEIRHFNMNITSHNSFENAQVTAGGIDTREIESSTMESKLVKGLYFAGEIVDVDGTCGGYNLQWAWSSGYVAGRF